MSAARPAPRALLVDLDDTILDYSGGVEESWCAACALAGPAGLDVERLVEAVAATRRWFWDDPERHRRERVDMPGAWRKIVRHALARLDGGREPDGARADLADAIAAEFGARRRAALRLYPGAVAALERFRARGLALGLVTNGDARQQRDKLERFALGPHFDAVLIEGEFGRGKPDAAVYRHVLDALGAAPGEAWMVGDHLEFDVAAPQALGLRVAWIDHAGAGVPPGRAVRPDRILRSLEDLELD